MPNTSERFPIRRPLPSPYRLRFRWNPIVYHRWGFLFGGTLGKHEHATNRFLCTFRFRIRNTTIPCCTRSVLRRINRIQESVSSNVASYPQNQQSRTRPKTRLETSVEEKLENIGRWLIDITETTVPKVHVCWKNRVSVRRYGHKRGETLSFGSNQCRWER